MQFSLPDKLREKVAIYDPNLKPLIIAEQQKQAKPRKETFALGLPNNLLPNDLCSEAQQIDLSKFMNKQPATERAIFTEVAGKGGYLIVWHHSVWLACWFFNKGYKDTGYIYGTSIAFKHTNHTWSKVPNIHFGRKTSSLTSINDEPLICKYGRSDFVYGVKLITKSDLVTDDYSALPFESFITRYGRSVSYKNQRINEFTRKLTSQIPHWEDAGIFARIRDEANVINCLTDGYYNAKELQVLDIDAMYSLLEKRAYITGKALEILKTPFFRKEIASATNSIVSRVCDPAIKTRREVRQPWHQVCQQVKNLDEFLKIYPDATLDHCQTAFQLGQHHEKFYMHTPARREITTSCPNTPGTGRTATEWIRNSVPIASYLNIIKNRVNEQLEQWALALDNHTGSYINGQRLVAMRELDDTISMLSTCIDAQLKTGKEYAEVPCPDRWRIKDWHDHISAECFKVQNPNENLRQDLLPTPISVHSNGEKWTYFQPKDIHQLALWGRAVRNCVGNASSYKEGIKKKTHFIVLAMIDNKPHITIQLNVRNGLLTVDQIADVANKRMTADQQQQFMATFNEALTQTEAAISEEV